MRVLIVKTSSLGDIVHTLPALSDAARARPGLRCDWLAERAFAEIPAWHPVVERVIGCDLRGWRRAPLQALKSGEWSRFLDALRAHDYDLIIDAQGLVKSAWLAHRARGRVVAGPNFRSAREPLAGLMYGQGCRVPRHDRAHAVERLRILFATALGYVAPVPGEAPRFGLSPARFPRPALAQPYLVLLHGTTWPSKRWPVADWCRLAAELSARGFGIAVPAGSAAEETQAKLIAGAGAGQVLLRPPLTELAGWLAHAQACVGVDTGLAHLAAALGTPQVTLYGPTQPQLTGAIGTHQVWLRSDEQATTIDRQRPNTVSLAQVQAALQPLLARAA